MVLSKKAGAICHHSNHQHAEKAHSSLSSINQNTFFPSTITTHPFLKKIHFNLPVFLLEILCLKKSLKLTNLRTERTKVGVSTEDTTMGLQRNDWSSKCWNFRSGWRLSTWLHRRFLVLEGWLLKLFPKGGVVSKIFFFLNPRSLGKWSNLTIIFFRWAVIKTVVV